MSLQIGGNAIVAVSTLSDGIDAADYITTYLTNGGSNDLGVNGSAASVPFTYSPPVGKNFLLARFLIYMEASGNFDSTKFMNLAALANGVQISVEGNVLTNWQDNIDVLCDMFDLSNAGTTFSLAQRSLAGRWTVTKGTTSEPIIVMFGQTVEALVRDNLSAGGIIYRIKVQGKLLDV